MSPSAGAEPRPTFASAPHDAAILLTPDSSSTRPSASNPAAAAARMHPNWAAQLADLGACNIIRRTPGYHPPEDTRMPDPPAVTYHNVDYTAEDVSRVNFAGWLFNPQAPFENFADYQLPFIDGGLESTFNNNIHYDYESLTSGRSQLETPPRLVESDELISELRRQDVLRWFQAFRQKQPKSEPLIANLVHDSGGDMPALNVEMMRDCLQEYWEHVSPRLPIVHQPTFSPNRCSLFLLMVMIALGAASLRSRDSSGSLSEYGGFADVIILSIRSEILTHEDAMPPVSLWAAQALLLLEFYEKMYSSRKLHERAHIYHSVALTLLRRGSPLIGRSGSESPPEVVSAEHPHSVGLDSRTWWSRWAETEAMHRVVFAAFMLDITHAAMFGHSADMAPHEIRLPLPCDDNLWTASNPDTVRQLDQNFRMYGLKPISFLDGLKNALHGKEVRTHSFGRMIIMSGLLSVGWHLSHRESHHLKWLDLNKQSPETQESWKKILLRAFDHWKTSFDAAAQGDPSPPLGGAGGSNGPIQSAAVLYHLAHLSLHVDIVDCQVYAGARRLLGRKVSVRDHSNVVARMLAWAALPATRHAVLHAFKLLHRVLVDPRRSAGGAERKPPQHTGGGISLPPIEVQSYSCRNETDPHRPWIMYYAALCISSFVRAIGRNHDATPPPPNAAGRAADAGPGQPVNYRRVVTYLSGIAALGELTEAAAMGLGEGLPDLLDALISIFAEAHSELLREAMERLRVSKELLGGAGPVGG